MEPNFYKLPTSAGNISIWDSHGVGNPVLFIHGNSACKEVFSNQIAAFGKKWRCIAFDLPGHGESDPAKDPEATYSFDGYSRIAIEIIEKMHLMNPIVVGWSLGGHIGLDMLKKAQKLAGLLITGTPPINVSPEGFQQGFLPNPIFATLFTKIDFTRDDAETFMKGGGFDTDKYPFFIESALKTDGRARALLAASMMNGVGGNQREIVENNNTDLCVVQGKDDSGINNEYIKGIEFGNLFNSVYIVENSGHAVFWEQPNAFNHILELFLAKVS